MSVLAFKALSYGAEQIPDKFFEKIPGGFFTPQETKDIKRGRKDRKDRGDRKTRERRQSEDPSKRRTSRKNRSLSTESSDDSEYDHHDTDYEREHAQQKRGSRQKRSTARSWSRSLSQGRCDRRSRDLDGQHSDSKAVAQPEAAALHFPPQPISEYRPCNPQEYASASASASGYGYWPQVNCFSNLCRATLPPAPEHPTPVNSCPPMLMTRPAGNTPFFPFSPSPLLDHLSRGTSVSAAFSPSHEPPLAALLQRPPTNSPKPAAAQVYPPTQSSSQREGPHSAAARLTSELGYAPSPRVGVAFPPPPLGTTSSPYSPPYTSSDYGPVQGGFAGNTHPSPPPLGRQRSSSQPLYLTSDKQPYSTYLPPSADQHIMAAYEPAPSPHGRSQARREERHRARSADSHAHSRKDGRRDSSRMSKVRERLDGMDLREKGVAATVGGALAGGLAGRQMGKSRLTTLVGVATGAIGGRTIADKRNKSRGERRSRSESRPRSRSRVRNHDGESKKTGRRARSRSVIHGFRSQSRGHGDRDSRADRRDRRPDRGYDGDGGEYGDKYGDGYSDGYGEDEYDGLRGDWEADGSSVAWRRRRRRDY